MISCLASVLNWFRIENNDFEIEIRNTWWKLCFAKVETEFQKRLEISKIEISFQNFCFRILEYFRIYLRIIFDYLSVSLREYESGNA
jgi:hypothetical protein